MDEYSYAYAEVKGDIGLAKTKLQVSGELHGEKPEYSYAYAEVTGVSDLVTKTNLTVSGESNLDKPTVIETPEEYNQNARSQKEEDQNAYTDLKFDEPKELEAGETPHIYTPLKHDHADSKRDGKPEEADIVYANDTVLKSRQKMKRLWLG